ncbi:AAA family ATPase [Hoeflea alexandrii]|uniref:AAA family ATPase n=1 Tax=Hoeflea alexandrii TaxID=288436 RepID=A0ABT1CKN4_9HYPH|nr:AAA family ATPase [Hoeflea alexandrii]
MSLLLRTIESFPRGRTTDELLVLIGAGFSHNKRLAALAELDELVRDGRVSKGRDGKWHANTQSVPRQEPASGGISSRAFGDQHEHLIAAPAKFSHSAAVEMEASGSEDVSDFGKFDHTALLRYWRSALRADPRGSTTQVADKHGIEWVLVSGRGPIAPPEGEDLKLTIGLDSLASTFREALVRREGHENALAIGWPIAINRQSGVPVFQPVGLLSARWERRDEDLILHVDADDVLVNPNWLREAARQTGWRRDSLNELFDAEDGVGLLASDFLLKLKDAVASQIRGKITGEDLVTQLDASSSGIFDAAALFLPTDSSFTAGAARDLDILSTWTADRIARTALAAIFDLPAAYDANEIPALNVGPLNEEQTTAVINACLHPLSVVTGPPGTGKSQAIISMAASVLLNGGSVIVASKNHQALDAVEDRLGSLAPDIPFLIRTLKPEEGIDVGFEDALKQMVDQEQAARLGYADQTLSEKLAAAARSRSEAMDQLKTNTARECEIADLLERIEARATVSRPEAATAEVPDPASSWWKRLLASLLMFFSSKKGNATSEAADLTAPGAKLSDLRTRLEQLRAERDSIETFSDPIALGDMVRKLATTLLPKAMAQRVALGNVERQLIGETYDDWTFAGGKGPLPGDLARGVLRHRPLWLASILGAPKRIPLDDGLFDLVIFDEASQCDIATAIPLFARAKRAVVVGDDQQLSFIAQLGREQDRNLMQAQNLPIAKMGRFAQSRRSLFDFASRVPNVPRITLRHQYRSAGPIVDYISENFYGGQLTTSYDPETLNVPPTMKPGLAWEHVPAPAIPQTGNVNLVEVDAIVRHLRMLLVDQQYTGSVGIISPFRAQVMALQQAVTSIPETKRIGAQLKVGTVDGFQGQERDLVLFSPCIGPRSPRSGVTFFQKDARRLNVAISRARAVAIVFGDLEYARSGVSRALQKLAARATEPRKKSAEGVFDSDWERKVFHALRDRGLDPFPQHEIAGRRLDFALFGKGGIKLDLEVDGRRWHQTPDGRRKTSDLWRDHQLNSMGWRVRRFWVDELASDMERCLDIIERDLS